MRKILLLTTLLTILGGASSVKARTSIDMSSASASTNATWTSATNTFAWTAENEYVVIPGLSGDLTGCYLDFTISAECHLDIVDEDGDVKNGGWNGYGRFGSGGSKTQDIGFMLSGSSCDITKIKEVRICSQTASGSLTVTSVSYYFPLKLNYDANGVATVPFYSIITSGGVTFDKATGTVTNTDGTGYLAIELPNSGIDLSTIKKLKVEYTGEEDVYGGTSNRILASLEIPGVNTWQGSRYDCDYTAYAASSSSVTTIKWNAGGKTGGSLTISAIKFTSEFTSCAKAGETVLNTLPWINISSGKAETPAWNMNGTSDTYYADGSGTPNHYVDITDYSELRVYCASSDDGFRAFFINSAGDATNEILTTAATWHESEKYYSLDLSTIEKWESKIALKTIKTDLIWKGGKTGQNVKNIVVYKTPAAGSAEYSITGKGILDDATIALLANANVTSIDVTGMTNVTATTLTSANPNCLFIANSGKLSNSKNVIVSGTCANLVLTDNKPFKAPKDFTATAVSYDRSFTVDNMTTVCLPFALTSGEASTLGTFYELSSVDGTVITFSEVTEPAANTPYLVIPTSSTLSIEGKSIAATPAETKSSASNIEFIGTLAATEIPASVESNNYYAFNNGKLVRIADNSATLPAFRAYIKATGVAGVKAFTIQFDDATGVNSLPSMDVAASSKFNVQSSKIYNVAGQRMSKLQKGLNIVNGKKVIVK